MTKVDVGQRVALNSLVTRSDGTVTAIVNSEFVMVCWDGQARSHRVLLKNIRALPPGEGRS